MKSVITLNIEVEYEQPLFLEDFIEVRTAFISGIKTAHISEDHIKTWEVKSVVFDPQLVTGEAEHCGIGAEIR